jgi:hypothetical protein
MGRDWFGSVGGIGLESYKTGRLCPLCGVDIDAFLKERDRSERSRRDREMEARRRSGLTAGRLAWEQVWDKLKLVACAAVLLLTIMAVCAA